MIHAANAEASSATVAMWSAVRFPLSSISVWPDLQTTELQVSFEAFRGELDHKGPAQADLSNTDGFGMAGNKVTSRR